MKKKIITWTKLQHICKSKMDGLCGHKESPQYKKINGQTPAPSFWVCDIDTCPVWKRLQPDRGPK